MSDFRKPGDGSFSLGSRTWPGMSKLVEECGEVLQIAGKLMGTGGKTEHWDGQGPLDVRMAEEVCDVFAAARAFFQLNGMDGNPVYVQREQQKYQQFLKWHLDNLPEPEDEVSPEHRATVMKLALQADMVNVVRKGVDFLDRIDDNLASIEEEMRDVGKWFRLSKLWEGV